MNYNKKRKFESKTGMQVSQEFCILNFAKKTCLKI